MLFSPVYAASHPRPLTVGLEGFFSAKPLRSQRLCARTFCRLSPKSHGIISFTDPYPLITMESYRCKNRVGRGHPGAHTPRCRKSFDCNTYRSLTSVANKRLTRLPPKISCLDATLTKNRGVGVFFPFWNAPTFRRLDVQIEAPPQFRSGDPDPVGTFRSSPVLSSALLPQIQPRKRAGNDRAHP
jgi:hypothetical protein